MKIINSYEEIANSLSNIQKITQKKEMYVVSGNFLKNILTLNIQSFENISFFDNKFNFYTGIPLMRSKKDEEDSYLYTTLYKYDLQEFKKILYDKAYLIEDFIKLNQNNCFEARLFDERGTKLIIFNIIKENDKYKVKLHTHCLLITEKTYSSIFANEKFIFFSYEDLIKKGMIFANFYYKSSIRKIKNGDYKFYYRFDISEKKSDYISKNFNDLIFSYDKPRFEIESTQEYKEKDLNFDVIMINTKPDNQGNKNDFYILSDYYLKILLPYSKVTFTTNGLAYSYEEELNSLNKEKIFNILNSIYESKNDKYYISIIGKPFNFSYYFFNDFFQGLDVLKSYSSREIGILVNTFEKRFLSNINIDNFILKDTQLNYTLDLIDKDKNYIISVLDSLLEFGIINEYKNLQNENKIHILSNYIFSYDNIKNLGFNYLFYNIDELIKVLTFYLNKYSNKNLDEIIDKLNSKNNLDFDLIEEFLSYIDKDIQEIIFGNIRNNISELEYLVLRILGKHKEYIDNNYANDLDLFVSVEIES